MFLILLLTSSLTFAAPTQYVKYNKGAITRYLKTYDRGRTFLFCSPVEIPSDAIWEWDPNTYLHGETYEISHGHWNGWDPPKVPPKAPDLPEIEHIDIRSVMKTT